MADTPRSRIVVNVAVALATSMVLWASGIVLRAPAVETDVKNLRTQVERIESKLDTLILRK